MNNVETWVAVALCLLLAITLAITLVALLREKRLRRICQTDISHMSKQCSRMHDEWRHMKLDFQRLLDEIEENSQGSVTFQLNSIRYVIKEFYKRRPELFREEFGLFQTLQLTEQFLRKVSNVAINVRPSTWKESDYVEDDNIDPDILRIFEEIRSMLASRAGAA